jgi:hypothetical protein
VGNALQVQLLLDAHLAGREDRKKRKQEKNGGGTQK